jgi:hypothetical protein
MEDELLQALKDFVATSNSGKYKTEEELLSKFPELQDYDTNVLKDFVVTSNSGKYKTEQELMSKFPEFSTPVKKKEEPAPGIATRTASELGLETQEPTPQNGSLDGSEVNAVPEKTEETQIIDSVDKLPQEDNEQGFWGNKWRELKTGSTRLGESIASYPEAIYRLGAIPQNLIADFFDIKGLKASPEKFKQTFDIENPVLDYYSKETEKLSEKTDDYYRRKFGTDKQGNTKRSAWDSFFEEGEYAQGFELLGGGIAESTATSLALMAGGAGMSALKLTAAATPAFIEGNVKQLKEEDPQAFLEMAESEITAKAFGMAAAETAFMSVGTGTLGKVYKDVILKEGAQKGAVIFKQGVIKMYETAFKKIGAPISAVGEGIEEMATTVTQNMIMGKDPNENVGESFLQGIGGGVMYGAPMTIIQAKEVVQNTIKKRNLNKEISSSKYIDLKQAFSLENSEEIDDVQISIASKSYSRDILQKELKKEVDAGLITQEESEQSMQVFDKTKQAIDAVEGIELTDKQKIKAVNLIKKKAQLTEKVKDKDPNLVSKELNEIKQIDEQLSKVRDENFLDLIPEEELQTLKDKAQRELMSEKEAEGVKDYKITEEEITERAIQIFESADTKPDTNENQEENSTQEEIVQQDEQEEVLEDDLGQQNTLAESVDEDAIYVKDGKRGKLVRQGDVISFETENEVIDIENNVENLDKPLSEFGINLENEVEVSIDENNNVTVNGQTYINNYSDPNSAISQNEKGEYTVSLETNKGEKRTFRGRRADQIVYQTKLKEYYDKSTPEQQAEAEKLADEAIVSRENKQAADKGKNKNPRQSEQEYLDSAKAERKAKLAKAESTPKPTISQQTQQFADEVSDTQEDLSEVSAGALQVTVGDSNIILNDKGDNIVIESVNTPKGKRGKGNARKALQKAVEVADKQNKTLELDVKPLDNTTTKKGLTSLYESLGFKADPNQKGKMIRKPSQENKPAVNEAKTPTKKETKPKVAKAASKPKKTKPTLKPNQVKRIKTKGVKGEFDVEIDIDGYVVKITSVKDGREVSKFTKPSKVKGKKTKPRLNANYSRIEKEALGQKTPNQIKQEQNKKINDAVTSFIPTNEYQAALEYVALGGNMSLASAKDMTGYSAEEVRWITGFKPDSELITLEQVAEDIVADKKKEGVAEYEESKVISGLQDILQENTSVTQVREKVLEIQSKIDEATAGGQSINEQQIAAFINNLTPQEFAQFEAIKAEDEFLSELSDKEAIEYYNEQAKNYEKGNEATIQGQENEGKSTTDNKGDEVIGQDDDGQQIKEQSDDEILNYLNEAAKKLGDFGKQNIGINLPVVIAQGVVQTVRIAYKAGKSASVATKEAIAYIKTTDWYRGLSSKQKSQVGSSTVKQAFAMEIGAQNESQTQSQGLNITSDSDRDSSLGEGGAVKALDKVQQVFKRYWNQTFFTNAGADGKVGNIIRSLGREVSAITNALEHELGTLSKILRKSGNKSTTKFKQRAIAINDYLLGKDADISFLKPKDIEVIDALRARVDALSDKLNEKIENHKQNLITKLENYEEGSVAYESITEAIERAETLQQTIEDNKGQYLHRSYDAFKNKNYLNNLTSKKVNAEGRKRIKNAVDFLMKESDITKAEAREKVFAYLESLKTKFDLMSATTTGGAKAPFLIKRKEIPQAFRELLGESKDPMLNYSSTVFKISNYIASIEYQENLSNYLLESGLGTYTAQEGYTKVSSDGDAWKGLSGIYVPVELYNSIQDLQPLTKIDNGFYKAWVAFAAVTKIGKTALSPQTAFRNTYSGVFLSFNAGFFFATNPKSMQKALQLAWGTKKSQKELRSESQMLFKLGILGDGAVSQEVLETINDFSTELERLSKAGLAKKAFNVAKKLYALGDDFYKVIGFYTYQERYIKSGMTKDAATKKAAQRITDTFPTYSMLPKNIRRLRRLPLVGTFVSFPYEVIRTTVNGLKYIKEDISENRYQMAMQQAAGMMVSSATALALGEISKSIMGFDDDDDDKIRDMLPKWQTNSKLIYTGRDEYGQPKFIDGTAFFPAEVWLKPLRTLLKSREGRTTNEQIEQASKEFFSPYLGLDISTKTMAELMFNRDTYDREIYDGENLVDGVFNDPEKIAQHYLKNAGPGVYSNIAEFARANEVEPRFFGDKYTSYGREYTNRDALMGVLGFRFTTFNYITGMTSLGYDNRKEYIKSKTEINNTLGRKTKLSKERIDEVVKDYQEANDKMSKSLLLAAKGARKLGVKESEIYKAYTKSGFSQSDVKLILNGFNIELKKIADQTLAKEIEETDLNYKDDKKSAELNIIYLNNVREFNKAIDSIKASVN